MQQAPQFLTQQQTIDYLKTIGIELSPRTLESWREFDANGTLSRILRFVKIGPKYVKVGRLVRYTTTAIQEWLENEVMADPT